jgi:AraC-like DNA-binding protein
MKIYIRNMVCARCVASVKIALASCGLATDEVTLGQAIIPGEMTSRQYAQLKTSLLNGGLELIEDRKAVLIEQIKNTIVEMIYTDQDGSRDKFSVCLSRKLGYNYTYLANIFSLANGKSIEHFRILHKIEKVKELLERDEFTLSEIAWKLHYSSVAHLSSQFKRVTGATASDFKRLNLHTRVGIDHL